MDASHEAEPGELSRSDLRLIRGALRQDWPIPDGVKKRLLQAMINLVDFDEIDDLEADQAEPGEPPKEASARTKIAAMRTIALFCSLSLDQQRLDLAREKLEGKKAGEGTLADAVADAERLAEERIREREQRDGEVQGERGADGARGPDQRGV